MTSRPPLPVRARVAALVVVPALVVAGCGGAGAGGGAADPDGSPTQGARPGDAERPTPVRAPAAPEDAAAPSSAPVADPEHAVEPPGPLTRPLLPADLLVYSQQPLPRDTVRRIRALPGVQQVERLSMAQVAVEGQVLDVAAVDPATYRRYTPLESARLTEVWSRVAGGELAILPHVGKRLEDERGFVRLGNDEDAPTVHIGAYAPQVPQVDAVLNTTWAEDLGMREGNAVIVSTGMTAPQAVRGPLQRVVGDRTSVQVLGPDLDISVQQTAFLTGGSVAAAVGTFSYRVLDGGRIQPDAAWVREHIRTESVPILGRVTCHKVMLPQFRAALTEIVQRGLADEIVPGQYAGCYYPRFIEGTNQPSLHSWGIAFDVNVPGNQRGTVGEIDRDVVAIFKKWGFAWGGDWAWTDPMHFELAALVDAR